MPIHILFNSFNGKLCSLLKKKMRAIVVAFGVLHMRSVYFTGVAIATLTLFSHSASAACNSNGSACYQQVVNPAVYATHETNVLVSPARRITHRTAAQYQTVQETVVLRPARIIARYVPATYSTVAETVMIAPAGRHWQVSTDVHGRTVGCWVNAPATYSTRNRQVQVKAANTIHETVAAVHTTRNRTQLVRPAGVSYETMPAQYRTVARQVMVQPASSSWTPIGGGSVASCGGRGFFGSTCGR